MGLRRAATVLVVSVLMLGLACGLWAGYLRLTGNIHEIEPGVYRAGQLSADTLSALIHHDGIRTVLNLSGDNPGKAWFDTEARAVQAAGADLVSIPLSANHEPSMKDSGKLKVPSRKVEGADSDGKSAFFLAAQDPDKLYKIDVAAGKGSAEYDTAPSCGRPTAVTVDAADDRVLVSCRGHDAIKPSLTVFDGATGKIVYSAEVAADIDSIIYDAGTKRIFTANGVSANLNVFSQKGPDSYEPVETLGTRAGLRTMAMDHAAQKIYVVTAERTADASKKIPTKVSPFYANTFVPNSFAVLTFGK